MGWVYAVRSVIRGDAITAVTVRVHLSAQPDQPNDGGSVAIRYPVLSSNAEHVDETPLWYEGRRKADQMVSSGEAIKVCKFCLRTSEAGSCDRNAGRHEHILQLKPDWKPIDYSATEITSSEMLANAGLSESDSFIRRARAKVEAWPFVGDSKAVRVCPAVN